MINVRRDTFGRVYVDWRSNDGLRTVSEKVMDEDIETILKRMRRLEEADDGRSDEGAVSHAVPA